MLVVLGTQGEYVVDVEKVDTKTVNLVTMSEADEPPGEALGDKDVLAAAKAPKKTTD
jgi:hypothetical protein